ncbi:MAG: hypothetical protein LC648_01740, partial [Novosphingobium sp.]|nr:hypothetical protein [Novosphingobium sp.]
PVVERKIKPHAGSDWFQQDRPTRGVNVAAPVDDVHRLCAKKDAAISATELLADGGTRVVMTTLDGADIVRLAFKDKLLPRDAKRVPLRGHPSYG